MKVFCILCPLRRVSFLVTLLILGVHPESSKYQLDTEYSGTTFFDGFNFLTDRDPTHGFVSYQDHDAAAYNGLISTRPNGPAYMGVDHVTGLQVSGIGRKSVRITTKKYWTHGLFISDIAHMPGGVCGTWPALWMLGPHWPASGEIDVIEGVNSQNSNLMSLHSSPGCTISGSNQTGSLRTFNCDTSVNGNSGCGVGDPSSTSYGTGFNNITGGVYAMEWTSDFIKIWFFPRGSIPSNIQKGNPDPTTWGTPISNFAGQCVLDDHFANHQIIFDTTFCGDWAGAVWEGDPVCRNKASMCVNYVAEFPEDFEDAYWSINSVKVYIIGSDEAGDGSQSTVAPTVKKWIAESTRSTRSTKKQSSTPKSLSASRKTTSSQQVSTTSIDHRSSATKTAISTKLPTSSRKPSSSFFKSQTHSSATLQPSSSKESTSSKRISSMKTTSSSTKSHTVPKFSTKSPTSSVKHTTSSSKILISTERLTESAPAGIPHWPRTSTSTSQNTPLRHLRNTVI